MRPIHHPPLLPAIFASVLLMAVAACSQRPAFDPLAEGAVVLAFGDSITYGTGAGGALNYPAYLSHDTGWQVVNAGVPGDTAHGARDRIGPLLTQHRPEMVIVELGGNDFLRQRPPGQVKEDLRAILRDIAEADALVVLLAVPRLSLLRASTGTLADAELYRELADEEGILLIEDVLSDVLSEDSLRADPIHPNTLGYERLAKSVQDNLRAAGLLR
jgi:acyl-CoA hydrolase